MSSAAIAPATRDQVIARSKRRGAWPMSVASAPRWSALDEEDSRGSTITAFELDRSAGEVVVAGPHVLEVETLDDHDLRAEERLVRGITFLLRSLRLDREVVDTDELQAPVDAPARRGTVERDEIPIERLHGLAPALAVARLEQDPLDARGHAGALEPGGADMARAVEGDDATGSHERVDRKVIDRARALDEMHRRIDVRPGVVAEGHHGHVRGIALRDAPQRRDLRAVLARPGRHARPHHERNVVHFHGPTSTTVLICAGSCGSALAASASVTRRVMSAPRKPGQRRSASARSAMPCRKSSDFAFTMPMTRTFSSTRF